MTRDRVLLRGLVFGAIAALMVLIGRGVGVAYGQPVTTDQLDGTAGLNSTGNSYPSLTSNSAAKETFENASRLPSKPGEQDEVSFRPHANFRASADGEPYKKMYKELIVKAVPVLFSTGYMIENGGFTGVTQAIQAVQGMGQLQLNSAQFEFDLRGVNGHESQKRLANRIFKVMEANQASGGHLNVTGLVGAQNDKITEPLDQSKEKLVDASGMISQENGVKVDDHLPSAQRGQNEWNLVENLFSASSSAGGDSDSRRMMEVKEWILKYVGNVLVKRAESSQGGGSGAGSLGTGVGAAPFQRTSIQFVRPTERRSVSQSGGSGGAGSVTTQANAADKISDPTEVFGTAAAVVKERDNVWAALNSLLQSYCDFKLRNENSVVDARDFSKKFASKIVADGGEFRNTSSNRLKLSMTLLDSIFKVWVQLSSDPQTPTKIQCEFASNPMPINLQANSQGADNSDNDPQNSRRNKMLYRFADTIARDRVVDDLRTAYEVAIQQAMSTDGSVAIQLNNIFCSALAGGVSSSSADAPALCDIGYTTESLSADNQQRWNAMIEELFKLAQNLSASSNFRFDPNHSYHASGGNADASGDSGGEE